jgi:hypothetical protein|tara:strand:+ start:17423 stop:17587 length:165 start_codon:yes stop_codon:yes gene_type:complete
VAVSHGGWKLKLAASRAGGFAFCFCFSEIRLDASDFDVVSTKRHAQCKALLASF